MNRSPATSALAALSLWLLFTVFWSMLAPLIASAAAPVDQFDPMSVVTNAELQQGIARASPFTLFGEMTLGLLHPATRALGLIFFGQLQGAVMGAPLPFSQSALLVWPQFAGLIAAMIVVFTIAYVVFQRQEIRA